MMRLRLVHNRFEKYGIFGELLDQKGSLIAYTLERSYVTDHGDCYQKLNIGTYKCEKGSHRLVSMDKDFITFEIKNVPDHDGIIFHVGNYNEDSEGCVLLGSSIGNMVNGDKMLTGSIDAFNKFMSIMKYEDEFQLIVEDDR